MLVVLYAYHRAVFEKAGQILKGRREHGQRELSKGAAGFSDSSKRLRTPSEDGRFWWAILDSNQ